MGKEKRNEKWGEEDSAAHIEQSVHGMRMKSLFRPYIQVFFFFVLHLNTWKEACIYIYIYSFYVFVRWQVLHHTVPDGYMITIDGAMMKVNKSDYDELGPL